MSLATRLAALPLIAGLATFVAMGFFAPEVLHSSPRIETLTVSPTSCDLRAELDAMLPLLGENPADWYFITPENPNAGAEVDMYRMKVSVRPDVRCDVLGDYVRHEHMHLEQNRKYAGRGQAAYGDQLEIVADCASQLIGSQYAPYVAEAHGCPADALQSAQSLVAFSKDRISKITNRLES